MGLIDFVTDKSRPKLGTEYELLLYTALAEQKAEQKAEQNSRISPSLTLISTKRERVEEAPASAIIAEWEKSPIFCSLDDELKAELTRLVAKHGEETIRRAMRAAKYANGSKSINFNYFLYKLKELLKGGKAHGENEQPADVKPTFDDGNEPWAKYVGMGKG